MYDFSCIGILLIILASVLQTSWICCCFLRGWRSCGKFWMCRPCDICFPTQWHSQSERSGILSHWRALKGHDHPRRGEHLPGWNRAVSLYTPQSTRCAGETEDHWRAAKTHLKLISYRDFFFFFTLNTKHLMRIVCLPGGWSEGWEAGRASVCLYKTEERPVLHCRGDQSFLQRPGESPLLLKACHSHTKNTTVQFMDWICLSSTCSLDLPLQDPTLRVLCRQLPSDGLWKGSIPLLQPLLSICLRVYLELYIMGVKWLLMCPSRSRRTYWRRWWKRKWVFNFGGSW